MQRRKYLKGLAGAGGIVTVTRTGQAREHDLDHWEEEEEEEEEEDSVMGLTVDPIQPVKVGIIGLGNRGSLMTQLIDAMAPDKGVIKAICDLREEPVQDTLAWINEKGNNENPDTYSGSKSSWKKLVQRDDLDLVFIFTPHKMHVPMAESAMKEDKHVAVEVPAATTIEECWTLVDTAEKMQKNCMMLENVCYFDNPLWVLNMERNGVFGDQLNFASGAYRHNLVENYFFQAYWNDWRSRYHLEYEGDLYPTHGLGPIAFYMGINRGDRLEYIASQESPESRLTQRAQELDKDHWAYGIDDWANGDTTRSEILTNQDRQIHLQFDVKTNRGYSLMNELAGSDAYHEGYPSKLAVDSEGHGFVDDATYEQYREKYRHPLWEEMGEIAEEHGGHGGGDFLEIYRIFDAFNDGRPLDMDVYDAAAWSAVRPLSRISINHGGKPVEFPDFTRGKWREERKLPVMEYEPSPDPEFATLKAAYDNNGITADSNPGSGNFDGAGNSFSAQALANAGLTPGSEVTTNGVTLTWPEKPFADKDNVQTNGERIKMNGSGNQLGFLGSAIGGNPKGDVTVIYGDGGQETHSVTFPNWTVGPGNGAKVVAACDYRNTPDGPANYAYTYYIYFQSIPLQSEKTIEYVKLPKEPSIHIFSMAIGD